MLHLVGETIDKHRVQYGVETGRLVQIMRGIYVAAEDDADAVLIDHALRIAAYLYPNTYLCGSSAERLAPTPDRRLFLSGRRNARTRLRDLEIVQTRAPDAPETETVQTADPMGNLRVRRSTLRFRYLESFRRRSEAAAAMTIDMQVDIAARLVEAAGGRQEAIMACWRLGEVNGWRTEAARSEQFISTPPREALPPRATLHVGWHGEKIGLLSHDGSAWRWEPVATEGVTPVRAGPPGRLPPFIESLLPEGWLERVLRPKSEQERISGKRYMSNIVVSEDEDDLRALPADILEGRLERFANEGAFAGGYAGPAPSFDETLEDRMAGLYATAAMPRLSGVQIKAPMNLSHDGMLRPARDQRAFTHILKPAPGAGFEVLPWSKQHAWRPRGPAGSRRPLTQLSRCRTICPTPCWSSASISGETATTVARSLWKTWLPFAVSRPRKSTKVLSNRQPGGCEAFPATPTRMPRCCFVASYSRGSSPMAIFT